MIDAAWKGRRPLHAAALYLPYDLIPEPDSYGFQVHLFLAQCLVETLGNLGLTAGIGQLNQQLPARVIGELGREQGIE